MIVDYLERIFFLRWVQFLLSGKGNRENRRIWRFEWPNEVIETLYNSLPVISWCFVSKNETIGPYFFENVNVTRSTYKRNPSIFFISQTARLPTKHNILIRWCISTLRQRSKAIFGYEAPKEDRRVDQFPGLHAFKIWPHVTTFCGKNWKIFFIAKVQGPCMS